VAELDGDVAVVAGPLRRAEAADMDDHILKNQSKA